MYLYICTLYINACISTSINIFIAVWKFHPLKLFHIHNHTNCHTHVDTHTHTRSALDCRENWNKFKTKIGVTCEKRTFSHIVINWEVPCKETVAEISVILELSSFHAPPFGPKWMYANFDSHCEKSDQLTPVELGFLYDRQFSFIYIISVT